MTFDDRFATLRALADQATPGPWELWTSNSFRRISHDGDGDVLCGIVQRSDGMPDLYSSHPGTLPYIAACSPDVIRALLDAAEERDAIENLCQGQFKILDEQRVEIDTLKAQRDRMAAECEQLRAQLRSREREFRPCFIKGCHYEK